MHGKNRIGYSLAEATGMRIQAYSPLKGEFLPERFQAAGSAEVDAALKMACQAFKEYRHASGTKKAEFLEAIAEEILALGTPLVDRIVAETALPEGRILGERGRTIGQLRLFASLLRDGSWVDASIDQALPDREPLPRPDIRKMLVPIGPVVVFTASNFPLAFSTAGGDTVSALAAGNPVIVKAHESHLGTNELISDAIARAAQKTGMPDGVFSSLAGSGYDLGLSLVKHPLTRSVAFTGSFKGGMALHSAASQREDPIPVFAEMGSINPVHLLPEKLENQAENLATSYAASITMGVGQFCTNPGVLIGIQSAGLSRFTDSLAEKIEKVAPATMLNPGIAHAYATNSQHALAQRGVRPLLQSSAPAGAGAPVIATVSARDFIENPNLTHEVFGPFSLLIVCENESEMLAVTSALPGQLTTTFMASDEDVKNFRQLIHAASEKCGRVIFNGVPTGVEVCYSMQHGGPFPSSSDSRFTSVGTDAIRRFVRPISFQDTPEAILPDELKNQNPLSLWRKVNGKLTNESIR